VAEGAAGPLRLMPPEAASPRFRRVVAPMAPWVFVAPGVAFAFLPTVVHAGDATGGIALTAAITALTALAGVLVQPLARRLGADGRRNLAATVGLLTLAAGLALAAVTAGSGQTWMLVPSAIVFGAAYGLGLVAGLAEVQRIADQSSLAALTAVFYALTYLGFAAPFVLALAGHLASYTTLLAIASLLALATAGLVTRRLREPREPG
jgi:MFS family permease